MTYGVRLHDLRLGVSGLQGLISGPIVEERGSGFGAGRGVWVFTPSGFILKPPPPHHVEVIAKIP